jgi:hypothetical protein
MVFDRESEKVLKFQIRRVVDRENDEFTLLPITFDILVHFLENFDQIIEIRPNVLAQNVLVPNQ